MTIEEAVNELDELTMYVEHTFTEEHKCKSFEDLQMAIKALEKQIPKEPSQLLKNTDYFHWECPICHMSYGMATQKVKYCYNCGQAIKWEQGEEYE